MKFALAKSWRLGYNPGMVREPSARSKFEGRGRRRVRRSGVSLTKYVSLRPIGGDSGLSILCVTLKSS